MRPTRLAAVALLALLPLAAACGSDEEQTSSDTVAAGAQVPADVTVIDVRTPEEFAAGHLEGAVNLNVEDGTLQAGIADLDPTAEYIVYCRSGRRSAIAAEAMAAAGFTSVTDLGALEAAAAETGLPIVTG
jgi:rhodanese-related sulfurtransferase